MTERNWKVRDLVKHQLRPEWGLGQICSVEGQSFKICFRKLGERGVEQRTLTAAAQLQRADAPDASQMPPSIPEAVRHKWRFLAPCEYPRKANSQAAREFDAKGLKLRVSRQHGGIAADNDKEFVGTCDRCDGEGFTLFLVEDVNTGQILQMGKDCRDSSLGR